MSRFDGLFKDKRPKAPDPQPAPADAGPVPPGRAAGTPADAPPAPPPAAAPRRPGRPSGKKSDPAFEQVTAYVRSDLYGEVRSVLWNRHGRKEFSELVGELLAEWLGSQNSE